MSALDNASLLVQFGNLWVGDNDGNAVDLGAVRNVRFTAMQERTRVNSDNRGDIVTKARLRGKFEFDWLEPGDLNKVENLFKGLVTKSSVAGSIVNNYSQVEAANGWAFNTFIPFDFQDADGTAPVIDSVTGGTNGALTVNVDYIVQQHADGRWGIVVIDSTTVTTVNQTLTIQIDYTPATALVLTGGTSQTATPRYIKIVGLDEDNSLIERVVVLAEAIATSDLLWQFLNVENAGDVGVMPVVVESNQATTWTITDEINPS